MANSLAAFSRRAVFGAGFAASLGGCVVAPLGTYYRPSTTATAASYGKAWCQGNAGPLTRVEWEVAPGVRLGARTDREVSGKESGVPLRIELTVPAATELQFTGPVRLVSDGRDIDGSASLWAYRATDIAPGEWVDPQRARPGAGPQSARDEGAPFGRAVFRFRVPGFAAPRLRTEGLAIEWEDRSLTLPAGEGMTYAGEAPAAAWRMRWINVPTSGGDVLEGEFELRLRIAGRWKLRTTEFRAVDVASGRVATPRPFGASIMFADRLLGGLRAAETPARIHLDAQLPAGIGEFDALLPALRLNGQPVQIAPIRFTRRSFDVAVQPFNC